MDALRPRVDLLAFGLSLALVALPAVAFVYERNGAAAIMCAMCLGGLVAGRIVGVPGSVLLPVAFGLTVMLCLLWIDSPIGPRKTGAVAHTVGGILAGWAFVEVLRHRMRDPLVVAFVALSAVIVLTLVWELGEYAGDWLVDTASEPSKRDSAQDILFRHLWWPGRITFGGVVALRRRGG